MECKLLDLSKETTKLFSLNKSQREEVDKCFAQIKDIKNQKLEKTDVATNRYKIALIFFRPDVKCYQELDCKSSNLFRNIDKCFDFEVLYEFKYDENEINENNPTYSFLAAGIKIEEVK